MTMNSGKQYEKLSDYARRMGLQYQTVWKQYKRGALPQVVNVNGSLFMPLDATHNSSEQNRAALYARVSSSENKSNLESQAQRLYDFATARGLTVAKKVTECASGLNEERPKLWKLLNNKDWDVLIVEHKDRLTRFGFSFVEALINEQGRQIIVINNDKERDKEQEIIDDLVAIITSFTAQIYGNRHSKRKTEKIIRELRAT